MSILRGIPITDRSTKNFRACIWQYVEYLRHCDIDRSGRGYYFPREGTIEQVKSRQVCISGSWLMIRDICEIVIVTKQPL